MNELNKFKKFLNKLDIRSGDILYVSSDIIPLLTHFKKEGINFNCNKLIEYFLTKIGKNGTLLFPTFNWDFCRGISFDYFKTKSMCGSLSNLALKRKDFMRTKHPIYSFAVSGKYKQKLIDLEYKSGFGKKSIFDFLYKNSAKNLFIGIDYKKGFTFDHYCEEIANVNYRYHKFFKGKYINDNGETKLKEYSMYVRKLNENFVTGISDKMDKKLIDIDAYKFYKFNEIYFGIINLKLAGDLMIEDIKKGGGLIYKKKL